MAAAQGKVPGASATASYISPDSAIKPQHLSSNANHAGRLIVNADDWGRDQVTTDRTLDCFVCGALSSVSAMVFMEDSERAAAVALERGIDAGLHLNLSTRFTAGGVRPQLAEHHERLSRYLMGSRLAQVLFHPGLARSFEYVVAAQREEFFRLYGVQPDRIDGHHHMHLAANVVLQGLMPAGTAIRRNFSFRPGEKSLLNRWYRGALDGWLARRHRLTDYFFSLPPLDPGRLQRIFSLSHESTVELETHPVNPEESRFLSEGEVFRWAGKDLPIAKEYTRQPPVVS
ncbi:MAG: ChbG/HpnK family deacetylase [Terriglobia bacterium]